MYKLFTLIIFSVAINLSAQKIDNTASFRNLGEHYFRFTYENDLFAATDFNYTQGYMLEFTNPALEKNPINYLFINPLVGNKQYGLAFEHIGFTPKRIVSEAIQIGDRPFASVIMLKIFLIATNNDLGHRVTSTLNVGAIGPIGFGEAMQVGIHKAIGDRIPKGWPNQIQNDLIVSYQLGYEKELLELGRNFYLGANGKAKAGSLYTNASIGITTMVGLVNSPLSAYTNKSKFQLYGFAQPQFTMVGYDATLQGGFFNKNNPYTIAAKNVERFTAQVTYGMVLTYKSWYVEYAQVNISKEFSTGKAAGWGGVKIGFTL